MSNKVGHPNMGRHNSTLQVRNDSLLRPVQEMQGEEASAEKAETLVDRLVGAETE